MAPEAALAVPLTKRDATPNAGGSQIDPSVAITPSGQRLIAATDADDSDGAGLEATSMAVAT